MPLKGVLESLRSMASTRRPRRQNISQNECLECLVIYAFKQMLKSVCKISLNLFLKKRQEIGSNLW